MDMNLVILGGRLSRDPEIREFESGGRLVRYAVTVRSDEAGCRTDIVPVTLWNPTLDDLAWVRGDGVWITGMVQRRYRSAPGGRQGVIEVVASSVRDRTVHDLAD
jgi:single-stranded DNA-binding protein